MKNHTKLLSSATSILVIVAIHATRLTSYADVTWDGSESSNWGDSGNWVENVIPGTSDNVYLNASGYAPTNQNIVDLEIKNLSFDTNFTENIILSGESIALDNIETPDNGQNVVYHTILCDIIMTQNLDMNVQDNITIEALSQNEWVTILC